MPEGQSALDFIKMKKAKEKLPSASYITKADDIELIELSRESSRISEDLIMDMKDTQTQTDDSLPMRERLGLDVQLRSIRGLLKAEVAKRFSWKNTSRKSNKSSRESENILESTTMAFKKTSPSELTLRIMTWQPDRSLSISSKAH